MIDHANYILIVLKIVRTGQKFIPKPVQKPVPMAVQQKNVLGTDLNQKYRGIIAHFYLPRDTSDAFTIIVFNILFGVVQFSDFDGSRTQQIDLPLFDAMIPTSRQYEVAIRINQSD